MKQIVELTAVETAEVSGGFNPLNLVCFVIYECGGPCWYFN